MCNVLWMVIILYKWKEHAIQIEIIQYTTEKKNNKDDMNGDYTFQMKIIQCKLKNIHTR